MNTIKNAFNIGVDVGKHRLDFFCHESGEYFRVANTPEGIRMALKQLKPLSISRLVVAQPIAVRRFAGALGVQSRDQGFLPTASEKRKAQKGRHCCLYAQNDHPAQRHGQGRNLLGRNEKCSQKT
jgi:hypothetical protein